MSKFPEPDRRTPEPNPQQLVRSLQGQQWIRGDRPTVGNFILRPRFLGEYLPLLSVEELAKKKGVKMAQIAVAWSLKRVTAPIVGTTKIQNLKEVIGEWDRPPTDYLPECSLGPQRRSTSNLRRKRLNTWRSRICPSPSWVTVKRKYAFYLHRRLYSVFGGLYKLPDRINSLCRYTEGPEVVPRNLVPQLSQLENTGF